MSMSKKEILERLKGILYSMDERSGDIIETINEQTNLQYDLGLTSVNMLYLIIATEEEFQIRFSGVSMNEFQTVGDVISYIEGALS